MWDVDDGELNLHYACGKVACQSGEGQCRGGVHLVRVDDVHVCADEDCGDAEADDDGGGEGGPDGDVGLFMSQMVDE